MKETNNISNATFLAMFFAVLLLVASLLIYFLLPSSNQIDANVPTLTITDLTEETEEELSQAFQDYFTEVAASKINNSIDDGLTLYRQPLSRAAVEWFYFQITGNKDVTQAILTEAEKNNIPLSLAFALAHTESNYNIKAVNKNTNSSIDRGLFQLNSNSFTELTEEDFFDPYVSSKYGMSHLKFCLNTAGNEVSALAMYNAGTTKVRQNRTPQITLNYVGKIMTYQKMLDQLFSEQVVAYYDTQMVPGISVAYTGNSKH
ncbi:MAG: transglycosylase SLT domain-containing protein [Spirochaetia bacterium]|nr:transglycosylase SLT domain-containing protein [Spirochaetia bacterium]